VFQQDALYRDMACVERGVALTPLARAYRALGSVNATWSPTIGIATDEPGLDARSLTQPAAGKLHDVCLRLAREIGSQDRKLLAAAFALRFGAAASATIGPFMVIGYVPALRLHDVALSFDEHVLLERVALRAHRYEMFARDSLAMAPSAARDDASLAALRSALCVQAEPVVVALAAWSQLKRSALWGLVVSAWGCELAKIGSALGCPERALELVSRFVSSDLPAFRRRPRFFLDHDSDRICHVRGSCCLYYRIGSNDRCASCPGRANTSRSREL
jgi:hypothetical protein